VKWWRELAGGEMRDKVWMMFVCYVKQKVKWPIVR